MSENTALLAGIAFAPDGETNDIEAPAQGGLETPEQLAGYLAKIGKGGLLTHHQEVALSRKAAPAIGGRGGSSSRRTSGSW